MFYRPSLAEIDVSQLAQLMAEEVESIQLIDVREREEIELAAVAGFVSLPLSEFALWSEQIADFFDPKAETIVICHHGMRSAQMCQWLTSRGFTNVKNVVGGIDAYSRIVDATVPRYLQLILVFLLIRSQQYYFHQSWIGVILYKNF